MLVWLGERGTKTRFGQEKGHQRAFQPKVYATGGERCPLRYYKLFAEHRPAEMNGPECPFFLAIKSNRASNDPVWYKKSPLGKNQIGQFLSIAARNAGINQGEGAKVSNHSVRKTSISRLLDANVPENYVAQLSGHKSTESLNSYKTAGEHHQKAMSLTLSRSMSKDLTPSMNIYEQTSIASTSSCSSWTSADQQLNQLMPQSQMAANPKVSHFFSGVESISNCTFQVFNAPVTIKDGKKTYHNRE
ncbi:uncharacterized protein LOC114575008 [Exaiptasia diaphana]|uniref:ZMYM2-like/QRICH1 C-terminal domain-containing protein n=1 Tax=Exaiptasia diaphana TaxID=2652724 RepID=A0A913YI94_EXADI|nr:uncharacterized protein LOC114575008 [Exaiptasia diaphana]